MTSQQKPNHNFDENIKLIYDGIAVIVYALAFVVLLFTIVFIRVRVDGTSMAKTLNNQDRLIACNINYKPKIDDIVVVELTHQQKPMVKRIIAVGGQTINIDYASHRVYVDDELQHEEFINEPTAFMGINPVSMPIKVPEDCVFVMGDNRNESIDSRSSEVGLVNLNQIRGKVLFRYYPYNKMKVIE